jgi:putative NADPH-quinone reductase
VPRSICIIQGHPDIRNRHLCHSLAEAYADGAKRSGANVRWLEIAGLDIPFLQNPADFATAPPASIARAQEQMKASDHLVIVYPLWLGTMPALVKAFFEQVCRGHFAITPKGMKEWPQQMLKGKSARVIVTMGMPAAAYQLMFGAHGVRGFESGILGMAGVKPIRETLIGGVGQLSKAKAKALLQRIRSLGDQMI